MTIKPETNPGTSPETIINILQVASGDLWAGAEAQLFTLTCALQQHNRVRISVVLLNHGILEKKLLEQNIQVFILDETQLGSWQIFKQLRSIITTQQPHVIHTHRNKENILAGIAAFISNKTPSLRTAHGAPEHQPAWHHLPKQLIRFADWFCGRFLQQRIIAVSDDLASILAQSFPADKIAVIYNGVTLPASLNSVTEQNTFSKLSGCKVGIAGRLVPVKRIDLFIETAAYLKTHYPEICFRFVIYGDGPLLPDLQQLRHQLGVDDRVSFAGHRDNLPVELSQLDVLLMTSDHEGLPMILLEAMAMHLPVIAHAVGGIPALLDNGHCGELIHEHTAAAYARALAGLARHPDEASNKTRAAKQRIISMYSAGKNADRYYLEYCKLSENRKGSRSSQ